MKEIIITTKRPNGQDRKEIVSVTKSQFELYEALVSGKLSIPAMTDVVEIYQHNKDNE